MLTDAFPIVPSAAGLPWVQVFVADDCIEFWVVLLVAAARLVLAATVSAVGSLSGKIVVVLFGAQVNVAIGVGAEGPMFGSVGVVRGSRERGDGVAPVIGEGDSGGSFFVGHGYFRGEGLVGYLAWNWWIASCAFSKLSAGYQVLSGSW